MSDRLVFLLIAVAVMFGIAFWIDWTNRRKTPKFGGQTLLTGIGFSPRAWAKAKVVAADAERISIGWRAKTLEPDQQEFMDALTQLWRFRSDQVHGEPLDVQLQAFMLRPDMSAMLAEANAGLMPLKPSELWLSLFACVLAGESHTKQQLCEAVQRLEERAAERS